MNSGPKVIIAGLDDIACSILMMRYCNILMEFD